jgi:WD40 repeat protein
MAGLRLRREWPHLIEASLLACQGNVLACSGPASVRFWDLESGEPLSEPLECFPYAAEELMFVAGQKLLALGGGLWEWSLGSAESKILKAIDPAEPHLRYWSHPSGLLWVAATPERHAHHLLRVWRNGREQLRREQSFELCSVSVHPGGRWLFLGGVRRWEIWDLEGLHLALSGECEEGRYRGKFSLDGTLLALVRQGPFHRDLWIYDTASWKPGQAISHEESAEALAWSPDSQWLALYSGSPGSHPRESAVNVRDRSGARVCRLAHPGGVYRLAFAPDSRRLAVLGFTGGALGVRDVLSGRSLAHVAAAGNGVSLLFPASSMLVTGGYDGAEEGYGRARIRVWELEGTSA